MLPDLKLNISKKIFASLLGLVVVITFFFTNISPAFAQLQQGTLTTPTPVDGTGWVADAEVTFVGKTGVRSREFLDWTLENYSWLCVVKVDENQCDNTNNPLIPFWVIIRNIVYAVVALFVLATAFILIVTRGQSITVMRFIPRFVFILIFITLSFSIVQFIYQVADIIQGFFLRSEGVFITTRDLLYIGFDYPGFTGFRKTGLENDESAFISLLLVRLTAITYYVMTGILLVRKVILWFFIVISPVFPLLIFYRPIRNTAKIWVGEFFRWLLYAPLFAIFLHGLVIVWRTGIPLPFPEIDQGLAGDPNSIVYPTAINILLGGPGQTIGINNSVNLRDTFALYVIALIMLWVVILLPWLLLKIFLDYLYNFAIVGVGGGAFNKIVNKSMSVINPKGPPPQTPPPPPGKFIPAGMAKSLPFMKGKGVELRPRPVDVKVNTSVNVQESSEVLKLANLSIPKMRDIAKYESSMISNDMSKRVDVTQFRTALQNISNPNTVVVPGERQKFTTVREKLMEQKQKGNPVAASVISASQITTSTLTRTVQNREETINRVTRTLNHIVNPELSAIPTEKDKFAKLKDKLLEEKAKGNALAASILETSDTLKSADVSVEAKEKAKNELVDKLFEEEKKGNQIAKAVLPESTVAPQTVKEALPTVNKVQQVSLDDYEEVRKLWTENYQSIEPPQDLSGHETTRTEWIKGDIDKATQAISLLSSQDQEKVQEGMNMVANILPFLMIGGFSKSEVVAYLKAKLEAGKTVLDEITRREVEEDSMLETKKRETTAEKTMTRAAEIELPKETPATDANQEAVQSNEEISESVDKDKVI